MDVQWKQAPHHERGSCAVDALANACDVDWTAAYRALELSGRVKGKGTPSWVSDKAAALLGFQLSRVKLDRRICVATVSRYCAPGERYLCGVRGHVFAIVDGKMERDEERQAKRFVRSLFHVTKRKRVRVVGEARLPKPKVPRARVPRPPKPEPTEREQLQELHDRNVELVRRWESKLRRAQNAIKKLDRKRKRIIKRLHEETQPTDESR